MVTFSSDVSGSAYFFGSSQWIPRSPIGGVRVEHGENPTDGAYAAAFFHGDRIDKVVASVGPLYLLVKEDHAGATLAMMAPPGDRFGGR